MTKKFFTRNEVEKLRFFQVPKVLIENEKYESLGLAEKLVYGVLLDRTMLSMKNNWFDEDGYAYILFSGETLGDVLKVHEKTARRYINNLKKYGLLEERRMGRGLSNRIYLVQPDYIESDTYKERMNEVISLSESYPQAQTIDIDKKEQNVPSRSNDLFLLEGTKCSPNDTEYSDTDSNDTQSINLKEETVSTNKSISNNKKKNDRLNEKETMSMLAKKYSSEVITEATLKAAKAKNAGTVINNLYAYLDKICQEVEMEKNILKSNNSVNRPKTSFHNFKQRTDDYTEEQLEEVARRKREEFLMKMKN